MKGKHTGELFKIREIDYTKNVRFLLTYKTTFQPADDYEPATSEETVPAQFTKNRESGMGKLRFEVSVIHSGTAFAFRSELTAKEAKRYINRKKRQHKER